MLVITPAAAVASQSSISCQPDASPNVDHTARTAQSGVIAVKKAKSVQAISAELLPCLSSVTTRASQRLRLGPSVPKASSASRGSTGGRLARSGVSETRQADGG